MRNVPLLWPALCLTAGIAAGYWLVLPLPLLPLLAGCVGGTWLLWRWERLQSMALGGCFAVLGALLVERQQQQLAVTWPEEEAVYEAVVMSEPVEKPKTVAIDLLLTKSQRKLKCYLHKDARSRQLHTDDGLVVRSQIRPNSEWRRGTFDYRRYLETRGFTGSTFVAAQNWHPAEVSLEGVSRLTRSRLFFLKLRRLLLQRFAAQGLQGDEYGVVAAMTLGDKSALTRDMREVYAQTGAAHVLALSGLHLGIVYMLFALLVVGRRWRMVLQVLALLGIWAFVFLVGLPTSVVRAAVMLSVYALLALGHRARMSVNVLAFTAMAMLCWNPLALFDVGFQLSFLAVLSILLFYPLLESVFRPQTLQAHRLLRWLWGMGSVSLAAQVGVAPLLAYYFGQFSPWFLLTNFLVVPTATAVLYLSLAVLLVPQLSCLLTGTVATLNSALTAIAALPCASIQGLHPTWLQVVLIYAGILCVYLLISKINMMKKSRN